MSLPPYTAHTNALWPKAMAQANRKARPSQLRPVEEVAGELLRAKLPLWRAGHRKKLAPEALPEVVATLDRLQTQGVRLGTCLQVMGASRSALVTWRRWQARAERRRERQAWRAAHPMPRLQELLPEERAALLACRERHPYTDYRRLAVFLEREHGVHIQADTVYAVLEREGRLCGSRRGPVLWCGQTVTPVPTEPGRLWVDGHIILRRAEGTPTDGAPDMWLTAVLDSHTRRVVFHEVLPFDVPGRQLRYSTGRVYLTPKPGLDISVRHEDFLPALADLGAFLAEHGLLLTRDWALGYTMNRRFGRLPRADLNLAMNRESQRLAPETARLLAELVPVYNSSYPIRSRCYLPPDDLQRGPVEVARLLEERQRRIAEARAVRVAKRREERRIALAAAMSELPAGAFVDEPPQATSPST